MKKRQQDTLFKGLVGLLVALVFIVGAQYFSQHQKSSSGNAVGQAHQTNVEVRKSTPSKALAQSVLSDEVLQQLRRSLEWNKAGAFIVNENRTNLNVNVASQPYAQNETKLVGNQLLPYVEMPYFLSKLDSIKNERKPVMGRQIGHLLVGIRVII